jgi:hypothetical protein
MHQGLHLNVARRECVRVEFLDFQHRVQRFEKASQRGAGDPSLVLPALCPLVGLYAACSSGAGSTLACSSPFG